MRFIPRPTPAQWLKMGSVLALLVLAEKILYTVGLIPLVLLVFVVAGVVALRRRGRTKRSELGRAAKQTVGGSSLLVLTAMAAEHIPPADMASMLAHHRQEGWRRETAEIRAAIEALASTSVVSHLTWVQEVRRAENQTNIWRPRWMGGTSFADTRGQL